MKSNSRILIYPILLVLSIILSISCSKKDGSNPNLVTDVDGNIYHTVIIGTQTWMVENLKTTRYNDSTLITNVSDNTAWGNLTSDADCWYNNDFNTYKDYGALYNWYAVNKGKLSPKGWHVASENDWKILADYLGGVTIAAGKLKESGIIHWEGVGSSEVTNVTGFTALPGGFRLYNDGTFADLGGMGFWWYSSAAGSSTNSMEAIIMSLDSIGLLNEGYWPWATGFSVRCIKN